MRRYINEYIQKNNILLLHPDIWPFENKNTLNCGVIEQTIVDIGIGISTYRPVMVYGIAGFILYKGFESLKLYTDHCRYPFIIINAGANGCYDKGLGKGHQINDDFYLCKTLNFKCYEPTYEDIGKTLDKILTDEHKLHFIRLGYDTKRCD